MPDWLGVAVLAVATIAIFVVLLRARRRVRKETGSLQSDAERNATREISRELEGLIVDVESMCRDITARLDTKIRILNELLAEADEKLRLLRTFETRVEAMKSAKAEHPRLKAEPQPKPKAPPAPETRPPEKPEPTPAPEEEPEDERFKKIYELADAGKDLVTIARETGMPKGEIKLVLGLRKRKRESRGA